MEVNKIISHALQSMPPSKRQKAFAKDTSKLIHMGLNENNYGMSPKAVAALEDSMAGSHFYPDFAAVLLKKAAGLDAASGEPNKKKVATLTRAQAEEIAKTKMPDLNAASLEAATEMIKGTARSMGIVIED